MITPTVNRSAVGADAIEILLAFERDDHIVVVKPGGHVERIIPGGHPRPAGLSSAPIATLRRRP